jgi:CelD/BcsL family acetyltransferase involved in cellulose biosynthesis
VREGAITAVLEAAGTSREKIGVLSDLSELAESWDQVAVGSGSPMHHYAWVSACAETLSTPSDLQVVVVGTTQQPAALAPLVRRRNGLPRLELLGVPTMHEPMDLIYKEPAAAAKLAQALAQLGLPLRLERVNATSATVAALKETWRGSGVVICRPAHGCPWIALNRRWSEPEPPLAARPRSDLRRAHRHAEKIGRVRHEILAPTPRELDPLLDDAFRVEAASWKAQRGTALASDPLGGAFYRSYAAAACRAGILRVCFLRVGDRIAAMQLALECEERFWLLKIGYDEAFARCSPGMLLLRETVRHAAQRGLRSYEFLGVPEPWIRRWTPHVRPCLSIWAYPTQPWGMAALAADVMQAGWRRVGRLLRGDR